MVVDLANLDAIRLIIAQNESFAILTHVSPDGDAIGSALGFALALRAIGKTAVAVCVDSVPSAFSFLPELEFCVQSIPDDAVCFSVDAADFRRLGKLSSQLQGRSILVNIDHHISNTKFGDLNLVAPQAAATGEYLADLLPLFGLPVTSTVALCLLTGIVTDTLGFRTPSATAATLAVVMRLVAAGANLQLVMEHALNRRSVVVLHLWGCVLQRALVDQGLIWSTVTLADKAAVGYALGDDGDVVNVLSTVDEVGVAVLFVEHINQQVKVSWRSRNGFDVAALAVYFGGGGHRAAAGANLNNVTLDEAVTKVLAVTHSKLAAFLA